MISVDSEQAVYNTRVPLIPERGSVVMNWVKEVVSSIFDSNNVNQSFSKIEVIGRNNLIGVEVISGAVYGNSNVVKAENALVVGDNFVVDQSGIYTEKIHFNEDVSIDADSAGNLSSKDQFLTAFRTVDINGIGLLFTNGSVILESSDIDSDALLINQGVLKFATIPTYANEEAASSLDTGILYKTTTGEIRIKL